MRRQKLGFVAFLDAFGRGAGRHPLTERGAGLHREPVEGNVWGLQRQEPGHVRFEVAVERRGQRKDEIEREVRDPS